MRLSLGVLKQVYRGDQIYWSGSYNVEGNGSYSTMRAARDFIDKKRAKEQALRHTDPALLAWDRMPAESRDIARRAFNRLSESEQETHGTVSGYAWSKAEASK